jgi:hypothetical protein
MKGTGDQENITVITKYAIYIYIYIYTYIHMHAITAKKEPMNLRESTEGYVGGFGRRKGKEKCYN